MGKQLQKTIVDILKKTINRQLYYYLDICTRCSICKNACHQYIMTNDLIYLPAYRAELILRIYRKYLTRTGRFISALNRAREIDEQWLDDLYKVTYSCTGCRRCMYYCPFSIDTSWLLALGKAILVAADKYPPIISEISNASIFKGENMEILKEDIIEGLKEYEKELQEKVDDPSATIPVDLKGADILYVSLPGSYSVLTAASIFHQARANWTLSLYEPANFGYFLGDTEKAAVTAKRIIDEAKRLEVKEIVISECGHGYRVMKWLWDTWSKEENPFKIRCILEVMAEYIKEERIRLNRGQIQKALTYHDPCQLARNSGIYEEPRYILRQIATDFRELTPNREKNWCCGGGGGLQAEPELEDFRLKTGEKKVEQIRNSGAKIVVAPCDNCRLQLEDLNKKYNLDISVYSVMELVADATVISKPVFPISNLD
ncbi:MAG: (Fe-S)-binding protein [Desulfobacterales bacterium]|nr:MAG: (Fe-S)-binding protein [Desulfobacterales bacterium]